MQVCNIRAFAPRPPLSPVVVGKPAQLEIRVLGIGAGDGPPVALHRVATALRLTQQLVIESLRIVDGSASAGPIAPVNMKSAKTHETDAAPALLWRILIGVAGGCALGVGLAGTLYLLGLL
jgi:hypothetical protein